MIKVRELQKTYRIPEKDPGLIGSVRSLFNRKWIDRHALAPISFEVAPGEIIGLLGANGAGKTTLIKMLAGIMHPTAGTAEVQGFIPWERKNAFKQQIAIVLGQKSQLWPDLPAADSLLLLREIYGLEWTAYQKRLDFFLDTLDLRKLLKTQIRRLSLGERMKFELVAALIHEPKVIFLDEPTIGLDIGSQRAIRSFLNDYRKTFKPAMILTSHYMEDVEALCERLLILREGELVYAGSLSNVSERYAQGRNIRLRLKDESLKRVLIETYPLMREDSEQPGLMRLHISKDEVSETVLGILKLAPVTDLAVEEEDLGNIIDALQTRKGVRG
ncbi:MAG: ATP-binding cassette domain-containing protein [Chitinophagaceae bacterium]|nr:ATP-binding cassette domain-containing protein [Oligoflexus sp.]